MFYKIFKDIGHPVVFIGLGHLQKATLVSFDHHPPPPHTHTHTHTHHPPFRDFLGCNSRIER